MCTKHNLFYSRYINNNQLTSLTLDSWNQFLLKVISLKNMWVLKKSLHIMNGLDIQNLFNFSTSTLAHNDWHCDCNITVLQSILMSPVPYINDESAMTCNTPSELYNNAIISLDFFVEPMCYSGKLYLIENICFYCALMYCFEIVPYQLCCWV